jgi:hypothetical protein
LEVAPPGQIATNINPTFKGAGTLKIISIPKANKGKNSICAISPVIIAFGRIKIFAKSFFVNDIPIPSIINASETGSNMEEKNVVVNTGMNLNR